MKKRISTPYRQYLIENPKSSFKDVAKHFKKKRVEDIAAIKMVITKFNNENAKSEIVIIPKKSESLPFNNTTGYRKEVFRERKVNLIKKSGIIKGDFLHLPSQTCEDAILINQLIKNNRFKFIGCEKEKKTVPAIYKKLYESNIIMDIYVGLIGDVSKVAKVGQYAHVDFDFCGTPTKYFPDVSLAMKNKIVQVNGIIFMSFYKMRDSEYSTIDKLKDLIKKHMGSSFELVNDRVYWSNKIMSAAVRRIK